MYNYKIFFMIYIDLQLLLKNRFLHTSSLWIHTANVDYDDLNK